MCKFLKVFEYRSGTKEKIFAFRNEYILLWTVIKGGAKVIEQSIEIILHALFSPAYKVLILIGIFFVLVSFCEHRVFTIL